MTDSLTLSNLILACLIVAVGATVQGSVGFGMGYVAAPLLVLINPMLVPGPVIFAALALTGLMTWREHQAIDFRGLRWALVGRVIGTVPAAALLATLPPKGLALTFGILVLLAVAMSVSGLRLKPKPANLLGAGTLSGFMGTTVAIGGPPVALIYQDSDGPRLRGTLSGYFTVGATVSLIALAIVGRFGRHELTAALALVPGSIIGFFASIRFAKILDRGYTRKAVLVLSALSGLAVILRHVL